jgi:iron complex outermembrane recepter protein
MKNNSRHDSALVRSLKCGISMVALLSLAPTAHVFAQTAPAPANDVVVVTGFRASLQSSLNQKKKADVMMDAITADDIASFPEANLAESLQRIPGISIDRDNGEGRNISVRGLGGDFTRVRINGMEALSTGAANDSGTNPNRSRTFDFNAFASELFAGAQVRKTASANVDEGSLGATVDLNTGHPFDYKGTKGALSVEEAYYENGGHYNPRIAGLWSTRWAGGKLGFLISGAYQQRDTTISSYARQAGQADYEYRSSSWAGNEYPQRAGFAAPTGTTFPQTVNVTTGAITNTSPITNPLIIAALTGSDPTAYAALYGNGNSTTGRYDDSIVRIPALATLNSQELHSERIGVTSSFQMQLDEKTRVTVDYLYSRFRNESSNYQIQSVGLNRNNTNATLNTLALGTNPNTRRALYPSLCVPNAGSDIVPPSDCGQSLYGLTPAFATSAATAGGASVASFLDPRAINPAYVAPTGAALTTLNNSVNIYSTNPYNLDTYDYYNNPNSVGYAPNAYGINGRIALIGRPSTKVLAAHVTNGVADYLQLSNVDWRSAVDASFYTTEFNQLSINFDRKLTEKLKFTANIGASTSTNKNTGILVEFNAMDRPETFTYDERGSPDMPVVNPGFDVANPTNWGIVKGFSAMRNFNRTTTNTYKQGRIDFDWDPSEKLGFRFGVSTKHYTFTTDTFDRLLDTYNPTEKEAGVTVASLGSVHSFGQGLDVPAGTPTSFFAPSIEAFSRTFGFDCNCVNKYGDFRITNKRNNAAQFGVNEADTAAYIQADFTHDILGRELSGNIGVRQAKTEVTGFGRTTAGRPLEEENSYTDTLPSLNLNYNVLDNVFVRIGASKAMARPQLANLAPTISAVSIPTAIGATSGGTLTIGNTKLSPFRSVNYDFSTEWYFTKNALLSVAYFYKKIDSFPQTVLFDAPLSQFMDADSIAALKAQLTDVNALAYVAADSSVTARQFRDAPGGELFGWEVNYQQNMTFLPWFLKNTGVIINATHINSKLQYILDPGVKVNGVQTVAPKYGVGPWLNASPDAVNLTFFYEVPTWSARIAVAQRAGYYTTYPIAGGSCNPGLQDPTAAAIALGGAAPSASQIACDSPLVNDFAGSKSTTNVDGVFNWNFTKRISFRLEGLNLTNQTSNRYAYVSNPVATSYASTGRQITVGMRYKY